MHTVLRLSRRLIVPLAALMLPPMVQADVTKANNTTNLDQGASYVGGTPPTGADILIYNNTVAAANTSALGASLSVLGLQVVNPGGAVTINATAGATLTLGASGINLSTATQDLTINAALALGAAQDWNVGSRTMTITSALVDNGNALTFTGAGTYRGTTNAFGTGTLNLNNNLTIATYDGTARTFANTLLNINGNITFGQGSGGTGALTFNGAGAIFDLGAATRTLTTTQNTTLNGTIQTGTAGVGLIKGGGAILFLNGIATHSGPTTITGGTLGINANLATAIPNSNVAFGGNSTYLQTNLAASSLTLGTGAGQLQFGAASSGFSATTTNVTFTLNGGAPLTWGAGSFVQNNQQLLFGGNNGTHTATVVNDIDLGGVATGGGIMRTLNAADSGAVFEGQLAGALKGASGLTISGSGAVRLSGTMAYQGGTFVTNGVLGYDAALLSAPANLSTGAIETVINSTTSTSAGVAYTGAGAVPASFLSSIANIGSAFTVAAFGANNANGNYTPDVDFTLAPADLQSKLYLGAIASSTASGTPGAATMTGTLTPAGGTYRLGGGNGVLIFGTANQLTGANNVVVRTGGVVRVNNVAQNLTGTLTIDGGIFELNASNANISSATGIVVNGVGTLANAGSVNGYGTSNTFFARLRGGVLGLQNLKDATGALIGSQMVTLRGGAISAHDNDSTASTILVQNVTADYGYNQFAHQPQGGGSGRDQMTITNLTRNFGANVEFRSQYGALATASGDNGNINVTNINGSLSANTNGILGGWAVASAAAAGATNNGDARNFATSTANGIGVYTQEYTTAAATTLAAAGTGANVLTTGTGGGTASTHNVITADQTINSMIAEAAVNVTNGATLKIASGGLILRQNQVFLHSTDHTGKLTSGLASGELFVYGDPANNDDHRITSLAIVDNGATAVSLIKGGTGGITLGGINQSNTFSGPIVVNLGMLRADFRGTGSVLPGGVGNTITVRSGGTFSTVLDTSAPKTIPNNIILDGGTLANELSGGPTGNSVTYTGAITINSVAGSTATINSNANGTTNNVGDIIFGPSAVLAGTGNLTKTGVRNLDIQTANTTGFTGAVYVTNGTLQASGAGVLSNSDYYLSGGTLGVTTTSQTIKNLSGTGGSVSGTTGGTDSLTVVQTVDAAYHGSISNTQLTKKGNGHLYLSGTGDNGSGTLQVDAGVVTMAKASTHGVHTVGNNGNGIVMNGGTVRLGGTFTDTGTAAANFPTGITTNYVDQVYFQVDVVMNAGTFDFNGLSESFDGLTGAAPAVITNETAATTSILYSGQNDGGGTFAGTMQDGMGTLSYVKIGGGTQILPGNNPYTGPTEVRKGVLTVTGAVSGSTVSVKTGATLNGDGPLGGLILETGGIAAPGVSSIADLTVNSAGVSFAGGTLQLSLNGTVPGTNYDQVSSTGLVNFASDSVLALTLGFTPTAFVDSFTIVDNFSAGAIGGPGYFTVGGVPLHDGDLFFVGASQFQIQYDGGDGNDVVLQAVPEPGAMVMLLGGFGLLAVARRRRTA